jgi:hypothetical protein
MHARFRIGMLAVGALLSVAAYAHVQTDEPQPTATLTVSATAATPMYITAAHDSAPSIPRAPHRIPIEALALGAVVGATKRATRRKSNTRTEVPLYLDTIAHVQRKNDESGAMETVTIKGGVLVDDTDLTDDEIDELTAMRVIRHATPEEIDRLEQNSVDAKRAELVQSNTAAMDSLKASNASERAAMEADTSVSPDALAKLDAKQNAAVEKMQAQHDKALAKFDAQ